MRAADRWRRKEAMMSDQEAQLRAAYPGAADLVCLHEGLLSSHGSYNFDNARKCHPELVYVGMVSNVVSLGTAEQAKQARHPDFRKYVYAKMGSM